MHITITSFHINLYADKSYLINADCPRYFMTPQIQTPGKYTDFWHASRACSCSMCETFNNSIQCIHETSIALSFALLFTDRCA